jgi:hypothetical protein
VPWCDDCAKFWNPATLKEGACPSCGARLEAPSRASAPAAGHASAGAPELADDEARPRAPWHFKMLLVATVVYLGYRLYQGVFWVAHHL